MCSPDIPAADPNIGLAALRSAELSEEALNWYKDYSARVLEPAQREQAALNRQVTDQAMRIAGEQAAIGRESNEYHKTTFRPVEQAIAADAMKFNQADYAAQQGNKAAAEVERSFAGVGADMNRDLARRGVSQSAEMQAANASDLALAKAAAKAGASNKARADADTIGYARKIDAASLGRGIANQQSTSAQVALQGGGQASSAANANMAGAAQVGQSMGQGYNTAIGGIGQSGSLYGQASAQNIGAATARANYSGGVLGSLIGAGATYGASLSDKNVKKDRKKVKPSAATAAIESMDVETFKYDEGKVPEHADGKTHVSPTAQDFAKHVGGDGKTIDLRDEIGVTLAAVKDINERVKKLEARK